MATSIQPENQDPSTQTPEQGDTTQVTTNPESNNQPSAPAPAPVLVDNEALNTVRGVFQGALQEANSRAQRLEDELNRLRNQQQQQPQTTPEDDVHLLTSNPRQLFREELQRTIAPLNEQAQQWSRANLIAELKGRLANNPAVRYLHIPQIAQGLDQLISQTPQLNDNVVVALYNMAVGWYVSNGGNLEPPKTPEPQPITPTVHSQTVPTPPNIRPSAPITPPKNPQNRSKRTYTENERALMRFYNMTEEEYDREMGLAPTEVITGGSQ